MKNKIILLLSLLLLGACSASKEVEPAKLELPFTMAGVSYTLPVKTKTLMDNGWYSNDDLDLLLNPNSVIHHYTMRFEKNFIYTSFYNPGTEAIPLKDAYVVKIRAENRLAGEGIDIEEPVDIQIYDGINYEFSLEDIEKQLGEPVKTENNIMNIYTYKEQEYFSIEIEKEKATDKMQWINITNYHISEEKPN